MSSEETPEAQLSFKVKTSGDRLHKIEMPETATVLELKAKLATAEFEDIPVERQRLIYSGRVMKNDDTLASYKIKNNNTLHLVKSAASNHSAAAAAAPAGGATASGAVPSIPANMAAGTSAGNLLAGLTGARFAGQAPLPNSSIFGPDGGMSLPSESAFEEILNNPAAMSSMRETLDNPQFIDFMVQNNPFLRNMPNAREMLQSPMMRRMMTDPDTIRMVANMRSQMGGARGATAGGFPAPGATDTTPAGAASTPAGGNPATQHVNPPAGSNPYASMFGGNAPRVRATQHVNPPPGSNPYASLLGGNGPGGSVPMTPEAIRATLQQLEQVFAGVGAGGAGAGGNPLAGLGSLGSLGGLGGLGGNAAPAAPADTRPPEEMYAEQLRQLNDMGFFDFDRNVTALRRSGGNVQGAIQHLLGD